jgi:hypothetical protein
MHLQTPLPRLAAGFPLTGTVQISPTLHMPLLPDYLGYNGIRVLVLCISDASVSTRHR